MTTVVRLTAFDIWSQRRGRRIDDDDNDEDDKDDDEEVGQKCRFSLTSYTFDTTPRLEDQETSGRNERFCGLLIPADCKRT